MKTVTLNQVREFILAQPDNRRVNLSDMGNCGCGCIVTHIAREKKLNFTLVSFSGACNEGKEVLKVVGARKQQMGIFDPAAGLFPNNIQYRLLGIITYKRLKRHLIA